MMIYWQYLQMMICCLLQYSLFPRIHLKLIWWCNQMEHFPRNWPFVRGIHRSPANSPHKGQWRRALMFSLICAWINCCVNNLEAGDMKHHLAHYDSIGMKYLEILFIHSIHSFCSILFKCDFLRRTYRNDLIVEKIKNLYFTEFLSNYNMHSVATLGQGQVNERQKKFYDHFYKQLA